LKYFGAVPINDRVVIDGNLVTAAGVTAGIDGALRIASLLRGDRVAQEIQLYIQYAPEPPFNSAWNGAGGNRSGSTRRSPAAAEGSLENYPTCRSEAWR